MMQRQNIKTWSIQMTHLLKNLFFITLMSFSYQSMAANKSLHIIDKGQDGNSRYYTVACPNGTNGSIVVYFKETNVKEISEEVLKTRTGNAKPPKPQIINTCASPGSDNEKCSASWDMQTAAKASCK